MGKALLAAGFALLAALAAASPAAVAADEVSWHDVTLRLRGAIPHQHPGLGHDLELNLSRAGDGSWKPDGMGYSVFFDSRPGVKPEQYYSWQDHEASVVEARESGASVRLVVAVTIHSDPWVVGGKARYTVNLVRNGRVFTGDFAGTYTKAEGNPTQIRRGKEVKVEDDGPPGDRPAKGQVTGTIRADVLPSPVKGHLPLAAGEHPRLLFRKGDLPELKRRAQTPAGKAIVARLEEMLAPGHKEDLWDTYGYGILYQLTGEKKWADAAARNVTSAIADKIEGGRYGWYSRDGGYLRVGPSVAAAAAAYDMCYEAWDEDFRTHVAKKIQDRIWPRMAFSYDLSESDGQLNPRSNHYMNWNGGAGFAMLAIKGDPGTDPDISVRAHRLFRQRLKRGLQEGFGDHGWFWEGTYCGRFPTGGGLLQYMKALQVAEGEDYVTNCSQAQWLVSKWCFEVLRNGGKIDTYQRLMYAREFGRGGGSQGGDFAQGFGVMLPSHVPAVLYFYNHILEPGEKTYDALGPKQAAYSLVNWPMEAIEKDPAEVFGHVLVDRAAGFYVFRSGWKGDSDIVVSMWQNSMIMGRGVKYRWNAAMPVATAPTAVISNPDNSHVVYFACDPARDRMTGASSFAADFSGISGSPGVFASVNTMRFVAHRPGARSPTPEQVAQLQKLVGKPESGIAALPLDPAAKPDKPEIPTPRTYHVTADGKRFSLLILQPPGAPVEPRIINESDGEAVQIGRRTLRFDGEKFVLQTVK